MDGFVDSDGRSRNGDVVGSEFEMIFMVFQSVDSVPFLEAAQAFAMEKSSRTGDGAPNVPWKYLQGNSWDSESRTITKVTSIAIDGHYDAHAVSLSRVRCVSMRLSQTDKHVRIGLADDASFNVATYHLGAFPGGRIWIKESGQYRSGTYTEGSLLEVAIVDGNILVALLDGVQLWTWGEVSSAAMYAKVSPYEEGASVTAVAFEVAAGTLLLGFLRSCGRDQTLLGAHSQDLGFDSPRTAFH